MVTVALRVNVEPSSPVHERVKVVCEVMGLDVPLDSHAVPLHPADAFLHVLPPPWIVQAETSEMTHVTSVLSPLRTSLGSAVNVPVGGFGLHCPVFSLVQLS